jgi:hypothetical protein
MKKLLLTFILAVAVITAKAVTATIYVQADAAPFLYAWLSNGKQLNGAWPGHQLTQTVTKTNKNGETAEFWYQEFDIADAPSFSIIFNNGNTAMMQQTGNIANISSDRYFTYDGKNKYTDITEDYGVEIPDVEIQDVALISELNEWDASIDKFTEVERNARYIFVQSFTDEQLETIEEYFRFKIMVNSSAYLDWNTEGMTRVDPNSWMEEDIMLGGGNIGIDVSEEGANVKSILFTLEFAGGKDIYKGWTLTVEEGTQGIYGIARDATSQAPRYNLSGQRISDNYRGLIVTNGKKLTMK